MISEKVLDFFCVAVYLLRTTFNYALLINMPRVAQIDTLHKYGRLP